jgi:chromosome segregation ATPase
VYKDAYRQVDVPVSSLRQIQRTLALVADKTNKEIGVTTNQLQEIERKLLVETKQFNALVFNASRVDDVFKEVANRKQGLAEKLSEAVIGGRGEEVRNLMKKMSEIEVEYDGKKLERNDMYAILSQLEDKIARISADKTKCIVRISSLTAELEATQNEVISRSIQSAIDSFSAS